MLDAVVEGLQQEWFLALLNDILGKATYIQIVSYQVLNGRYFARDEPVFDLGIVFMAGDIFCFCLGWESIGTSCRRKEIAVGAFSQELPGIAGWSESSGVGFFNGCEEARDDAIPGNVLADILFGIVCPHLFLVDELLKNIAEDVGCDLIHSFRCSLVKMPPVFVEKGK